MDRFDRFVKVYVTGSNNLNLIQEGVELITGVLGAGTVYQGTGFWHGEFEPAQVIQTWFEDGDTDLLQRLVRVLQLWHELCQETAILVEVHAPDQKLALVVYRGEWDAALEELLPVFDRGEYLARWFESQGEQ